MLLANFLIVLWLPMDANNSSNKPYFKHIAKLAKPKYLLLVTLAIFYIFGFNHLGQFITADEHFWLPNSGFDRIGNYWNAVQKGEWEKTRINDKPGITLAYTSGIAMLFDNAKGQIISNGTTKHFDPVRTQQINFLYRLPILILSGLFSLFFFWIIRKITDDEWIALWSSIFILLSPILLGMSQIVNPDSLFWIFASASTFSFFAYLKEGEKKTAILAGLFLGLALASKYVSVILFPFFFFMMMAYYVLDFANKNNGREAWRKMIIKNALVYLAVIAAGMTIFALMMPASFVEPKVFYEGTIGFPGMKWIFWTAMVCNGAMLMDAWMNKGRALFVGIEKLSKLKRILPAVVYFVLVATVVFVVVDYLCRNAFINLASIPFDLKQKDSFRDISLIKRYAVEFRALVFALTPLVLFALIFAWIKNIFQKSKHEILIFVLSSFFLIFYAAVLFQGLLVTTRYSIILFPFSMVLAAIAIREFFASSESPDSNKPLAVFASVAALVLALWAMSYFNQTFPTASLAVWFGELAKNKIVSVPLGVVGMGAVYWLAIKSLPWKKILLINNLALSAGIIAISVINIWLVAPFYFSYTNNILPRQYIISGAWGYGGYEAAQYLNSLPNAKNLTVWADVYGVCEFFVGNCTHSHRIDTSKYTIDYYFRSLQSSVSLDFPHAMESKAVWRLNINGRPKSFLKIQKAKPITTASSADSNINSDNVDNADDSGN